MQIIIDFFRNNTVSKINSIISIISLLLSIYNFIKNLLESHKKIDISFGFITKKLKIISMFKSIL